MIVRKKKKTQVYIVKNIYFECGEKDHCISFIYRSDSSQTVNELKEINNK